MIEYIIVTILHLTDMILTILLIKKSQEYWKDAEKREYNYHKHFFKKFGVIKGALLSLPISLTLMLGATYYALTLESRLLMGILYGILALVVYYNLISYMNFFTEDTETKRPTTKNMRRMIHMIQEELKNEQMAKKSSRTQSKKTTHQTI